MKHLAGWLVPAIVACGLYAPAAGAAGVGLSAAVRGQGAAIPAPLADSTVGGAAPVAIRPPACESAVSSAEESLPGQEAQGRVVGDPAEPPRGPGRPLGWRALLPGALR
ncbi:MAG: hypothetical protein KAX77_03355 [Xanthomonadales bacterium]|nr:hypothetical protein [Xanthomonadales bacterium]